MILPTKHLRPRDSLIVVGAELLLSLDSAKTISRLWSDLNDAWNEAEGNPPYTFDWFILALDLLFALGAIDFERGLIAKRTQ